MALSHSSGYVRCCLFGLVGAVLSGCGLFPGAPPKPAVSIQGAQVGCRGSRTVRLAAGADDPALTYRWHFGDGQIADGQSVAHTYDDFFTGEASITVFATTPDGDEGFASEYVRIPQTGDGDGSPDPSGDRCVPNEGAAHVPQGTNVNYAANPPASGSHYSAASVAPIAEGFYATAIRPEIWVHNLEHGDVVILYDCAGNCPMELLDQLRSLIDAASPSAFGTKKLVLTRYPGLRPSIMAVAWNVQHDFERFDNAGLLSFHRRHVAQGPEGGP